MTGDVVLMAAGELAIAAAIAVAASLPFVRWAIERQDRRRDDDMSLTSAQVRALRRKTLLTERAERESSMLSLARGGYEKRSSEEKASIGAIDAELAQLEQIERYIDAQTRGMQNVGGL
jgi:hypothetical protein